MDVSTPPIPINKGVLQGGILSPVLFNIYINDLIIELKQKGASDVCAYADDIAVICQGRSKLEEIIETTKNWCALNKIGMNNSKSGIMKIKKRTDRRKQNEFISEVPVVHEYKYLGITISESLKLGLHMKKLQGRLKNFKTMMARLRPTLMSLKTRIELWKTFYRCHVQQAIESCFVNATSFKKLKTM